jgi:hypothetical protein
MLKKRYKFSFYNLLDSTPKEVIALQNQIKLFGGAIMASTYVTASEHYTLLAMCVFFLINELIGCIGYEK